MDISCNRLYPKVTTDREYHPEYQNFFIQEPYLKQKRSATQTLYHIKTLCYSNIYASLFLAVAPRQKPIIPKTPSVVLDKPMLPIVTATPAKGIATRYIVPIPCRLVKTLSSTKATSLLKLPLKNYLNIIPMLNKDREPHPNPSLDMIPIMEKDHL
jgi:hypothetical protein